MRQRITGLLAAAVLAACTGTPSAVETSTPTPTGPTSGPSAPGGTQTATSSPSPSPTDQSTPAPTTEPAATTPTTGPAATPIDQVQVSWTAVGSGFERPLQVLQDPQGRVLVVEQVGRIRTLGGATVLDIRDRVTTAGNEQGLLGVAFHPDGSRLFVHYSGGGGQTVLSSFPVDGGAVSAGDETVLLTESQPARNHNGGALLFDPTGALVLALGDGGAAGDRFDNGQDTDTRLGGLLRLDVSDPGRARPHPDNPFLGGGAPELWVYGLRNPWRIAFDDTHLYIADVGQDAVEEVSVVPRGAVTGANFGWPILEGTQCYRAAGCSAEGTVVPVAELRHGNGACSIIGGVVVPASSPTGLGGAYLYSDLCDTTLRALRVGDGGTEVGVVAGGALPASPLGFGAGSGGQVWVGTSDGRVLRLQAG